MRPSPTNGPDLVAYEGEGVAGLAICGVAVANSIDYASGVRVPDYPITLDKLIERLPEMP